MRKESTYFVLLSLVLVFSPTLYSGISTTKADSVIATIPVGMAQSGIFAIASDSANGNLYVTDFVSNTVFVISGQTNTVIGNPIPVGEAPEAIAFDSANGNLYVANTFGHSVSVISGRTNTVIGSPVAVGVTPIGIAFDSANGNLYVVNNGDSTVSVIAGSSNTVIGTIPTGHHNSAPFP
jgi:YVTN family beta-propeller protein